MSFEPLPDLPISVDDAVGLAGLRRPREPLDCHCSCHLRRFGQPTGDLHAAGSNCPCQYTPEERREHNRSWLEKLEAFHDSEAGKALSAAFAADRTAATDRAAQLGVEVTVECDAAPVIVSGRLGDTAFWFRERHGDWRLHRDGMDGPVIAEGDAGASLRDVIELVFDRLNRHVRESTCPHEAPVGYRPGAVAAPGSGPRATGRLASVIQPLHDPT